MAEFIDPAADLSIRETILGMMKTRDIAGQGKIHTSDFRAMAADLGYPLGHRVIENILIHCVINAEGLIDFTGVERELARERRLLNTNVTKKDHVRPVTSFSTAAHPWRADVVHNQKMQSERQAKLLQEFQRNVSNEFQRFVGGKISEEQFIGYITNLGLIPTKSFLELLRKNRATDIQFSEFMRSLINYDPSNRMIDTSQPAGGAPNLLVSSKHENREEVAAGLFYSRKRMDVKKKTEMRIGSDDPVRSGKKLVQSVTTPEMSLANGGMHQFFKNSNQIRNVLVDSNEPATILSSTQIDMRRGKLGKDSRAESITYTSEQRILREQVLAALRKMDAGEISSVEFQDKMFTMGVDLPDAVLRELQQYVQCGQLNWSACVQAMDDYVFKHKSILELDEGNDDEIAEYRRQMFEAIKSKGPSGMAELAKLFSELDEDGSMTLSYGEFLKGCAQFGLKGLTGDKYRVLFNSFDKNGDGLLSCEEFVRTLRGQLSRRRMSILFTAFRKLDKHGQHQITADAFFEGYDPSHHPDIIAGNKSLKMVIDHLLKVFNVEGKNSVITETQFNEYFSNLSAFIADDAEFVDMISNSFGVDPNVKAPPPTYEIGKGAQKHMTPVAKQVHGDYITWNQEPSSIESRDTSRPNKKKVIEHLLSGDPSGNILNSKPTDEYCEIDGLSLRRRNPQSIGSSRSLLAWDVKRKAQTPEKNTASQSNQENNKYAAGDNSDLTEEEGRYLIKGYHWSEQKVKQYAGVCPYGISEPYERYDPEEAKKKSSGTPKSLGSFVKKS